LLFINCRIFGVPPLLDLLPPLLLGLKVTVALTIGGTVVAAVAAFTAGLAQLSRHWPLRVISILYIDLFRGTSALVQLFWAYFALPMLGIVLSAMTTGIWVLGLNIGAYGAEVVRGAIQAIPKEQREAAIVLNFTHRQILWRIIIPQALPAMLPPFGNLLIELLKSTALVSMIALSDLTFQAQILRASTLRTTEIFLSVLILYFVLAQAIAFTIHRLERRFSIGK
jgi:polar amino acid transport system permease protein